MTVPFPHIKDLIPHRGRMLLIDRISSVTEKTLCCKSIVRLDNPFLRDGLLETHALIEYMAQAMAALVGCQDRVDEGSGPNMGFLVSARGVEIAETAIRPGDEIEVHVRDEGRMIEYGNFQGEVLHKGERVCNGMLSFYQEVEET